MSNPPQPVAKATTLDLALRARELDAADPLAAYTAKFAPAPGIVAYLDGNSLGRPVASLVGTAHTFINEAWGTRLIRRWDEEWMERPFALGDRLGALTLGAAPGQVFIGDSTSVLLYKLVRAAVAARPGRSEIVVDTENFPTDRYIVEGIAAEAGLTVRWLDLAIDEGATPDALAAVLSDRTAAVVLSHVTYRAGFVADVPALTEQIHAEGALCVWDLCHSVGVIPCALDAWGVDLAVGCTYKYLNGGPGSPAFAYVRAELQEQLRQPIQGWMGAADVFEMVPTYSPGAGLRRFLSGTPAISAMLGMEAMLDLIEAAGLDAIYAKSVALTSFAEVAVSQYLEPLGARLVSPPAGPRRGSHLTVSHPNARDATRLAWERGVIPDFRTPDGIRIGLSPLSTSFAEVEVGMRVIAESLRDARAVAAAT